MDPAGRKRGLAFLLRRLGQTAVIAAVTLVLAEFALRALHSVAPSFILSESSYNRFRGRPGTLVWDHPLNSAGFNDAEHAPAKPPRTYRIVALGDSFAFGSVPYRDNYLTLLEGLLEAPNRSIEVINMGISGTGPQDYLALLESEGFQRDPDLVLVSFFVGNDFTDTKRTRRRSPLHQSAVFRLLKFATDVAFKPAGAHSVDGTYEDGMPTWTDATFLSMEADRSRIYLKGGEDRRIFADAIDALIQIQGLCASRSIPMFVVVIPDEMQLDASLQTAVLAHLHAPRDQYDFALPNRILDERLGANRIEYLDLLEPFASTSEGSRLYKPNDSHWNIAGNRLAAELLGDFLKPRIPPNDTARW